jgi:(4S)-4-hydroxy-5-phosphonooxypentane-2,3-dione isomerase
MTASLYVNAVDLDIVAADFDKFIAAMKVNAAASVKEPGCHQFDVMVSANQPHHVFLYEVYDNAAALESHRATEHFKKYMATTSSMIVKREARIFSTVVMNKK